MLLVFCGTPRLGTGTISFGASATQQVGSCSLLDSKRKHSDSSLLLKLHRNTIMLRFTVFAVAMVSCSAFLLPQLPTRSANSQSITRGAAGFRTVRMMSSSSSSDPKSSRPLAAVDAPAEPFSGQIDRRTLLKAVPVTLAAGILGLAVGAMPQGASARGTPKAAPAGTKVVVLGGSGFVGSRVCEMLVEAGETHGRGRMRARRA